MIFSELLGVETLNEGYFYIFECLQKSFLTLPYIGRIWSSIVIVHEKSGFSTSFFRNISETAETILIKKKLGDTMALRSTKKL